MYGPWNVEYAKKYGFQKRDPNAKAPISVTPGQASAPRRGSSPNVRTRPARPWTPRCPKVEARERRAVHIQCISTEAVNAVYGSKLHRELEEKWKQCVSNRGLTPIKAGAVAEESPLE